LAKDLWWLATFLCAAASVVRSNLRLRYVCVAVLVALAISRLSVVLGSRGSAFSFFETPLAIVVAVIAVSAIRHHRRAMT
jgi:hypothetical protein